MTKVESAISKGKQLRVIGFDDAPFGKIRGGAVNISGVVCSDTRFEGMLWGEVEQDGIDSTEVLVEIITNSKFYSQLHAVLLDGIAFGGFNLVNLDELSRLIGLPCIAVMRRHPNFEAIDRALRNFDDYKKRMALVAQAGDVYSVDNFVFQAKGISKDTAAVLLNQVTGNGHVPEALRLAHLIGSAIKTGESSNRA